MGELGIPDGLTGPLIDRGEQIFYTAHLKKVFGSTILKYSA